jgi:hypothetical protein
VNQSNASTSDRYGCINYKKITNEFYLGDDINT